jgi:membrane carboxypeptidase/penicillin-binding protein
MTVRLAQEIGMPLIGEYAKMFGVYDELPTLSGLWRSAPARPPTCG